MSTRTIEILFFDGCPNLNSAVERARAAAGDTDVILRLHSVESDEEAREARFLGSPSVRVDGVDVEPAARGRTDFALQCRVYPREHGGLEGAPPIEMIRAALGTCGGPAEAGLSSAVATDDCCSRPKT